MLATVLVALIAPRHSVAVRAHTFDIPVRQKTITRRAVCEFDTLRKDIIIRNQCIHDIGGAFVVRLGFGVSEFVKYDV